MNLQVNLSSICGQQGESLSIPTTPCRGTNMLSHLRTAIISLALFTVITGILYPLVITVLAQTAFPHQANGSLILQGDKVIGSSLIGQPFSEPKYFWGR